MAGRLAANSPDLDAAVVFYGMPPAAEEAARIRVPLLLHYAGRDERINTRFLHSMQPLRASAGAHFEMHLYPDVDHAFHNDTNAARYNADAALLAWQRTVEFLDARTPQRERSVRFARPAPGRADSLALRRSYALARHPARRCARALAAGRGPERASKFRLSERGNPARPQRAAATRVLAGRLDRVNRVAAATFCASP